MGVSVVETDGGNEIPNARKVFGPDGFDIPLLMLIDEDAKVKTAEKLGVQNADLARHNVVISDPDLEGEYTSAIGGKELWKRLENSNEFTRNQLRTCEASGRNGERTDEDVAAFCRKNKNKVQASLIVAQTLTQEEAACIGSIYTLLNKVEQGE